MRHPHLHVLAFVLLSTLATAAVALGQATVATDKPNYVPGETVIVTGTGWAAGEVVTLTIHEGNGGTVRALLSATADPGGNILNREFVIAPGDTQTVFMIRAAGQTSGLAAEVMFADAIGFVSVSPQTATVQAGHIVSYTVTTGSPPFCWPWGGCGCWGGLGGLSVTAGLPAGASYSVVPAGSSGYPTCMQTSTLTIRTSSWTPVGVHVLTLEARDSWWGAPAYRTVNLLVSPADDVPPVANVDPLPVVSGECSAAITAAPTATDNVSGTVTGTTADPWTYAAQGTYVVHWTYTDAAGNRSYQNQSVVVLDVTPPALTVPADIVTLTDPGTCTARVAYTVGATDNCGTVSAGGSPPSGSLFSLGATTVRVGAVDAVGNTSTGSFTVTVQNPPPVASLTGPASGAIHPVGTPVSFTGGFTDNAGDSHTAQWMLDGTALPGTVDEAAGMVSATHTFAAAGVYSVRLTVADGCGGSSTASTVGGLDAMVVVYDPNAGFVTGGGWILSPPGAYAPDPSLTGKANFGFVSRYKAGAAVPGGETEFQFRAGGLDFHSASYQWLVIAGARAQYKGEGTINGAGDYGFLLTAVDGQVTGGGAVDRFRIKIHDRATDQVVYDNQSGADDGAAPTTTLGGGSIVIHSTSGQAAIAADAFSVAQPLPEAAEAANVVPQVPLEFALGQNRPNPFSGSTAIPFAMPEHGRVRLGIYDVSGRVVKALLDEERPAGIHRVTWSGQGEDGTRARPGVYFCRIVIEPVGGARGFSALRTMVLMP